MATNLISEQLRYFKRKRDVYLFFVFVSILVPIALYFIFEFLGFGSDFIISVYLLLAFIYIVLITVTKSVTVTNLMYYRYYRMLADDMGRFKVPVKPFTPTFFKNLSEEGFTSSKTHADFVLYYQFSKKLKGLVSASQSLIVVIMAKDDALDFYSDYINEEIEKIYKKHQEIKRVKNQIVLQFKKYGKYSEDAKKEADQIINFHQVNGTLLHITCGLFVDEGTIYYLRPKKAYPNRYYYYASETIKRLCEVKIEPNEIK